MSLRRIVSGGVLLIVWSIAIDIHCDDQINSGQNVQLRELIKQLNLWDSWFKLSCQVNLTEEEGDKYAEECILDKWNSPEIEPEAQQLAMRLYHVCAEEYFPLKDECDRVETNARFICFLEKARQEKEKWQKVFQKHGQQLVSYYNQTVTCFASKAEELKKRTTTLEA